MPGIRHGVSRKNRSSKTSGTASARETFAVMAVLKKKTRKKIRKAVNKAFAKHAPRIAGQLATGIAAGLTAYLGAEGEKGAKKLKHAAKSIPGGKKVAGALAASVPMLKEAAGKVTDTVTGSNTSDDWDSKTDSKSRNGRSASRSKKKRKSSKSSKRA